MKRGFETIADIQMQPDLSRKRVHGRLLAGDP